MAQHGVVAAREDRRHPAGAPYHVTVADCVHAAMDAVEPPRRTQRAARIRAD
jgi:hypothetical protein